MRSSPALTGKRIAALAGRQHGVVARYQLLDLGMSASAVGRAVDAGRFRKLHRGVYLFGPLESARSREMATVLSVGPNATASHTSAACLWELLRIEPPRPVHVTVPGSGGRRRPDIVVHRTRHLADDERAVVDGVPVTTPIRTIVDIAGMLGHRDVEQVLATAEREGLVGNQELTTLLERYPGRLGTAMLRTLVQEATAPNFTRSEAERRCLSLLRQAGLPRPETNVSMGPYELDLFWPEERLAIEIDGYAHHSSRARFEGDRRQDNWLRTRGVEVIRLTWHQITRRSTATAALVAESLGFARGRRSGRTAISDGTGKSHAGGTPGPDSRI
jgi:very-short-patch-repair endonuclease